MHVPGLPRGRLLVRSLFAVPLITAVGLGFDRLLLHEGVPRLGMMIASNLLTGIVAGALVYSLGLREAERRQRLLRRMELIAEANHHIRNALQVIVGTVWRMESRAQLEQIQGAVDRIQWVLREVLPRSMDLHDGPGDSAEEPAVPRR